MYGDTPQWFEQSERSAVRNGYAFEIAEKSEYESLEAFREHIEGAEFEMTEENGVWKTVYTSRGRLLPLEQIRGLYSESDAF